jgi:multidrug resistance efflux pump
MANTIHLTDCSEIRQALLAKPPWIIQVTTVLLIALTVTAVAWATWTQADIVVRAQGRVRPVDAVTSVYTPSGVDFEGRVTKVLFSEGSHVTAGQTLLQLDTSRIEIQIAEVQARLAAAQQEIATLDKRIQLLGSQRAAALAKSDIELTEEEQRLEQASQVRQSKIRHAKVELQRAQGDYERNRTLSVSNVVSQQELAAAQAELAQAQRDLENALQSVDDGHLNVLRSERDAINMDFIVRVAELEHQQVIKQGEIAVAERLREKLELQCERQRLISPIDGVIVSRTIHAGDVLESGSTAIEIAPHDSILFEANVPSEQVGGLRLGMDVRLKLDAFDYQLYGTLPGRISFIAPDSHVPTADGLSPTALYKVQVELLETAVGKSERRAEIKLGMGATAEIVTERLTLLRILLQRIRGSVSLG